MSYDKYTLEDIYEIFAEAENKVEQLMQFKSMNLPYEIDWDQLIKNYSSKTKWGAWHFCSLGYSDNMMKKGNEMFEVRKTLAPYGFQVIDTTTDTVLETFKRKYQANAHAFYLGQTTMKSVRNLMTGKEIEIPVHTPRACDPSSELYWSM